jgi:hypothetical protein
MEAAHFCWAPFVAGRVAFDVSFRDMSDRSPIYAASPDNAAEVQRALRICLAGMRPPAALDFEGGDFAAWTQRSFFPVLAPHAITVLGMARRGDATALIAADAALDLSASSVQAGRHLLDRRAGARYLPVLRRFTTAVDDGKAEGHFATVLALQAADFSVAELPLLQCLLFCEWRAGQSLESSPGMDQFFREASGILPCLPSALTSQGFTTSQPSTGRVAGRQSKSSG